MCARRSRLSGSDDAGLIKVGCLSGCFALPCSILGTKHIQYLRSAEGAMSHLVRALD